MKNFLLSSTILLGFILSSFNPVIGQDSTAMVTINITIQNGDSPSGAMVILTNHDGITQHVYSATSGVSGIVVFPGVILGVYDLSVQLMGFSPYEYNNINVDGDLTFDVLLNEIPNPIIEYSVHGLTASWRYYPVRMDFVSETWDSLNFSTNNWGFNPSQGNWTIYDPNALHPEPYAQFGFWPQQTNYSYSLVSDSIWRHCLPVAWLKFDLSFSNFSSSTNENLAVEAWDGLSWTEVTTFSNQDYPDGIPWTTYTYDITDQLQGTFGFKIRFRAWGEDTYNINWWDIDNIKVYGETESLTATEYVVHLNGEWPTQDTSYTFPPSLIQWGNTYTTWLDIIFSNHPNVSTYPYNFTSTYLSPPQDLEGEIAGQVAHLTWQLPRINFQSYKSKGFTWDELLAYNHLTNAQIHHPDTRKFSCGLPPRDSRPMQLLNPNGTLDIKAIGSKVYGYNAYSPTITWDYPVKFNLSDPGNIEWFGPSGEDNFFAGACFGPDDLWYVVRYLHQFGTVDTATGEFTIISVLPEPSPTGLAWDPTTTTMYLCTYGDGKLWTIDPSSGDIEMVGGSNAVGYIDMVCTNEGHLYAMDISSQAFGAIDKTNGDWTPLIYSPFTFNYAQGMSINRQENTIYWAAYNDDIDGGQLWMIDPVAETMYYLGDFEGNSDIDGMVITSGETPPMNVIGYKIYRDETLIDSTDAGTTTYDDSIVQAGLYTYAVSAIYEVPTPGESEPGNPVVITCEGVITGTVNAPGPVPIPGLTVTISNEFNTYTTTTGEDGSFSITVAGSNYTVCTGSGLYEPQCIENVVVPCDSTITLEFELYEMSYPPLSVSASVNEADSTAFVNWYDGDQFYMIGYDDNMAENATAWEGAGNMNAVRFTPALYPADIYGLEVNIFDGTWPQGNILTPFKMAIYDDDGDQGLPGTKLAEVDVTPFDYGWAYADFSYSGVSISSGDFYGVMIQEGNYPDCAPIGIDNSDFGNRSYSRDAGENIPWRPSQLRNFMIRAYVYLPTDRSIPLKPEYLSGISGMLEGYKVYVLPQGQELNPDAWTLKAENLIQTNYTDSDWATYPAGWYRYAVVGIYTHNESEPAFSNPVEQILVGINEPDAESMRMYPVPAKDIVNIEMNENMRQLKIFDFNGQIVLDRTGGQKTILRINTTGFEPGCYLVKFITNDCKVTIRKLVVIR